MRALRFGRWGVVLFDFLVTIIGVFGGLIAAVFFDGPWWLPVVALVYLATFRDEARRVRRYVTGG